MSVLIAECSSSKELIPVIDVRLAWDISCGCFSNIERISRLYSQVLTTSYRLKEISALLEERELTVYNGDQDINLVVNSQFIPAAKIEAEQDVLAIDKEGNLCYLQSSSIDQKTVSLFLKGDLKTLSENFDLIQVDTGYFMKTLVDAIEFNGEIITSDLRFLRGDNDFISPSPGVYIHKTARVDQSVSLNSENGPIIIDKESHIRPFTIIDGPGYIGKNSLLDSAKIRESTSIRDNCKIGGEVEASIIESHTNKHHEGFLGHSYLGSWVNIGAMATTSDLKNNYGTIRLQIAKKNIQTSAIKLGSLISDFAKIGIGLMLNTGTVISTGANIFQEKTQYGKYVAPFQWGQKDVYDIKRFIKDVQVIMSRRGQILSAAHKAFIEKYYKKVIGNERKLK